MAKKKPGCLQSSIGCGVFVVLGIVGSIAIVPSCLSELDEAAEQLGESMDRARAASEAVGGDPYTAAARIKRAVKESLKAPTTAKFPFAEAVHVGDDVYQMASYVDSQNSFGAMIRTHFVGEIARVDGVWGEPTVVFADQ